MQWTCSAHAVHTPQLDAHLLDDRPVRAAHTVGPPKRAERAAARARDELALRVHVGLELPAEVSGVGRRHLLHGAQRVRDVARASELGLHRGERRVLVQRLAVGPALVGALARVLEDVAVDCVHAAPRVVRGVVGLDLGDGHAARVGPVGRRQVVEQVGQLLLPLGAREELDLAAVERLRRRLGRLVPHLDERGGARAHAVGRQHAGLVEQRVEQRRLARARVADDDDGHAGKFALGAQRLQVLQPRLAHRRRGPRGVVVRSEERVELAAHPLDEAERVALVLQLRVARRLVERALVHRRILRGRAFGRLVLGRGGGRGGGGGSASLGSAGRRPLSLLEQQRQLALGPELHDAQLAAQVVFAQLEERRAIKAVLARGGGGRGSVGLGKVLGQPRSTLVGCGGCGDRRHPGGDRGS
eukprot:scaffold3695_cov73-Phaeocystis_antarctica.AAC.2